MHVDDLEISPSKVAESSQRIIDRAIEDARRREHPLLTNEHLFLAFTQVEWDLFAQVMRDVDLNPHTIREAVEAHLQLVPAGPGRDLRVSPSTKLAFRMALHQAGRSGRQAIELRICSRPSSRRLRASPSRSCAVTASTRQSW